jgi:hypothetical protein
LHGNKTLEVQGTKTIHILAPGEKDRATVNYTITMAGDILKGMVIFKGEPNGRITKKELPTFFPDMLWAARKNAWCDERCMRLWADGCLIP